VLEDLVVECDALLDVHGERRSQAKVNQIAEVSASKDVRHAQVSEHVRRQLHFAPLLPNSLVNQGDGDSPNSRFQVVLYLGM
jgi:hypothetical protein